MWNAVNKAAKKSSFVRLSGIFVGAASSILSIAAAVAGVAEVTLKGLGNILGASFSKECKFRRGVENLTVDLFMAIVNVPVSVFMAPVVIVKSTVGMARDPVGYSEQRSQPKI